MENTATSVSKITQYAQIGAFLDEHKSITPMDAWSNFYCTKLATRIGEMERKGMIQVKHVREKNEKTGSHYMRYVLVEDEADA